MSCERRGLQGTIHGQRGAAKGRGLSEELN